MARSISKKINTSYTRNNTEEKALRKVRIDDLQTFEPITNHQNDTFTLYREDKNLLLHGIAGTGKTFLSLYLALEEVLDPSNKYKKITIVRSVVPTRDMGFLKGTAEEKISAYEAPYNSICRELFAVQDAYESLKAQGSIEFISTSFIRGITFNDTIVIVDECENLNFHELDSIITRIGKDSKILFCGDHTQSDFTKTSEKNGIVDFMKILKAMSSFAFVEFEIEDIVRSALVKEYIINKYKLGFNG